MKNENRLLSEIADVLHTHEDGYVDGAWEAFLKKKKRRRALIYFRVAGTAAALLLVCYAAWLFMPQKPADTTIARTKNHIKKSPYSYQPKNMQGKDSVVIAKAATPVTQPDKGPAGITKQLPQGPLPFGANKATEHPLPDNRPTVGDKPAYVAAENNATKIPAQKDSAAALPGITKSQEAPPIARLESKRSPGTERLSYDELVNRGKPKPAPVKHDNNLSYALLLSPSVGNEKMNFGTGVEIAYNINKNFSVSSGLAYATMHAAADRSLPSENTQAGASTYAIASPKVQGVNISLSGFEVPLNIQYKTNSGFYLSAGISAVSVVKNNLSYNYLSNRAVPQYSSANAGLNAKIEVVSENTTSQSAEKVNGYIGFYTFSAGKKINFGKGKLNFAPFIKIPFGPVSSENLQLMQGGIQLGIGF